MATWIYIEEEKQLDLSSSTLDPLSYEGIQEMHVTIFPRTTNGQSERWLVTASN